MTTTKYTVNGVDQLGDLPVIAKETEFVNAVSSSDNQSATVARKELKGLEPLSSVGLNIGLHMTLGGAKTKK